MKHQKSILFIYPHADPFDANGSGGQNRLYNLIQETEQRHQITVIAPNTAVSGEVPDYFTGYRQQTSGFLSDIDPGLAKVVYKEIRQDTPDVIHIPYPSGIALTRAISAVNRSRPSIVLDAHDVMSERAAQFTNENLGPVADRVRKYYTPTLESVATKVADHIITVSEKDKKLMYRLNNIPPEKQTVVPNGAHPVECDELENPKEIRSKHGISSTRTTAVFHGNCLTGTHNLEAAKYINRRLAPKYEKDVEFVIIGEGTPNSDKDNVTNLGFVDDLYSTLYAMDIAVVPLRSGTATKLKMFDYMSVKLPILSTHKGTEGIDLEEGEDVIIKELGEEFNAALETLVQDPSLRKRLGESGRSLIESKYNWKAIGEKLNNVYQAL